MNRQDNQKAARLQRLQSVSALSLLHVIVCGTQHSTDCTYFSYSWYLSRQACVAGQAVQHDICPQQLEQAEGMSD